MEVNPNSTTDPMNMYNYLNNFFMNPAILTSIVFVVIIFAVLSFSLDGSSNNSELFGSSESATENGAKTLQTFGTFMIAIVVIFVIVN